MESRKESEENDALVGRRFRKRPLYEIHLINKKKKEKKGGQPSSPS